jgi:DNA-binding NtrC family response regulator
MQKRILADHSVISDIISERLRREGYLIEEAKMDQKALTVMRPENYAAIISDVFSDGLRLLEKAKVIPFPVPVILISTEHVLTRNEAIQLGADELIEPSDLVSEQLEKIKNVLEGPNCLKPALAVG